MLKEDNNTESKPLLNHAICHKPDQSRMKNKNVTEVCIVEN